MKSTVKRSPHTRVLVPLTLAGATAPKLAAVAAQARALDAHVTLLHILDETPPSIESPRPAAEAEAASFLSGVAAHLRRDGVNAQTRLRYGSVVTAVCANAREQGATMIIVGASETRGWDRLIPGAPRGAGLAGAISRDAPCPVLLVRRTAPDEQATKAA